MSEIARETSAAGQGSLEAVRARANVRSQRLEDLARWVARRGFEPYRASQIAGWLYNRPLVSVGAMHTLPVAVREALEADFDCRPPAAERIVESRDGTRKLLVRLADGQAIESVLIPRDERTTLCLSSQVGCGLGCRFCATARIGFRRNLEAGEMVAQVLLARELARPALLTNYVFMGMGEPLANREQLLRALEIFTARWGLGISPRRITVSTVGLVPDLVELARRTKVNLAVSLNATDDTTRSRLMPVNRRYPIGALMDACRQLDLPRRKRITFEYVLLAGVNDRPSDATRLVELCRGLRVKVNLIPFNPFPGSEFSRPSDERVVEFQNRLLSAGVHATVRASRGGEIHAACGQLVGGAS
ncbi:MAG: 23S rRNA (adenine(2503)-C(2))-methyltransferase RlmN [Candidatus Dadabacteria bacterium]|nr:MAG: 23S rRNA (adenine(2503)-C(2))-methyltransferase RlmN [Candidatus Dadabacteria bacterium]